MAKHVKVLRVVVTDEVLLYGDELCYHRFAEIQPVRALSRQQCPGPEEYTRVEEVRCPVYSLTSGEGTSYLAMEPELLAMMEDYLKLNDEARQSHIQYLEREKARLAASLAFREGEADKWKRRALYAERELDNHTNTGFWKRLWMTITKEGV